MAKDEYVPFTGKLDAAPEFEPFSGALDGEKPKEPGFAARLGQGASRALDSAKTALTDDPNKIAQIASEQARTALPQSDVQRKMAAEFAPYVDEANKAEGVIDNVKAWGAAGFKRAGQLVSNPGETAKMIAEQLPNSLPGIAGGFAGAKAGAALGSLAGPVGTAVGGVLGGVAGGFAGSYGLEKGAAMQDQVQKEAQAQRIDLQDESAVARMVALKRSEFDAAAQRKGVGTAGTDALLNVATMGLAGVGGRTLAKEARTLAQAVKAGTISAADAAADVARLQAANAARNTLGAKALRGAGVVGAEMGGEGFSEGVGQKLAYGSVDAGEVIDESLMGIGTGGAMALGSKAFNKAAGIVDQDATTQNIAAASDGLGALGPAFTTAPGAADPNAPQAPVQPAPEAPDLTTSPGAGVARDGMDFTREVDTSGLSLQDPAELERARAAMVDYQPGDTTPQWETSMGAAAARQGLDMPAPEFDADGLGLDPIRQMVKQAADAGGALSPAAGVALDLGATNAQFLGATGRDVQLRQTGPGVTDESNIIDVDAREVPDQRGIPAARRLTNEQEGGARATSSQPLALPAPTNLREGLERIRAQRQEAANAQAAQAPAPAAAPAPGPTATAVEAAGLNRPKSARKSAEFDARKAAEIEAGALGAQEAEAAGVPTQFTWPAHRKWVYSQAPRMTLREFQVALKGRHGMSGPEIEAYYKSSNGGAEVSAAKITTEGAANVPQASQTQQTSPQPTQAAAPAAAAGLTDAAAPQNLGAQAAPAASQKTQAIDKAPGAASRALIHLAGLKGARLIADDGRGRKLIEVNVTPEFRRKHFVNGRMPMVDGLELKEKSVVTGNVHDNGYVLIDNREQLAARRGASLAPGAQGAPAGGTQGKAPRATTEQLTGAQERWQRMTTAERQAVAARTDVKPILRKNLHGAKWENLNVDVQRKLQAAMEPIEAQPSDMKAFKPETGTLGVPRSEMPQVPSQSHGGLVKHLNSQGISHETTTVDAGSLKPTQAEYSPAKVEAAKGAEVGRAVIVSKDGHIIDGHHQAMAAAEEGKPVKAIVLDAPVQQALEAVKNSPSAQNNYRNQAPALDAKAPEAIKNVAEQAAPKPDSTVTTMRSLAQQFRDRHAVTKKDTDRTFAGILDQFAQDVEQGKRTPQSVQQAIERYQELAAEPFQATQTAPATHADPGQAPEVATPAVVAQSVQKAARNEDTKPSEMRKWLVGKIDEAIAVAPEAAVDFLSFDVPGDGTFKVQNSQARLQEFRKKVMASPGFKDGGQKQNTKPPEQVDSAINGSGSTVEAIRNFLADGDVQSAIEFAKLKGVEFTPVEPRASITANGKFKRVPASVKSSVPSVAEGLTQVEAEQINQYLTAERQVAEAAAQPITRADVTAAQQQAAAIITERIDAMTAGEVNTIARRFLPTMGVRPTVSKERNKAAVTDFTKVNPLAAAEEFGAALPADVRRVLQADMEGRVTGQDGPMFSRAPAAFSFAGQQAVTADQHALTTAQQRLDAGEDAEAVRQDTGWFKGTDGKWRFEINDADAKLLKEPSDPGVYADIFDEAASRSNGVPLGKVLDHPALFAAYPALKATRFIVDDKYSGNGSYSADENAIRVRDPYSYKNGPDQLLSVLLHEIQHGIQDIEGFASGGSPNEFRDESADAEMLRDGAILAVMMRSQGTIEKAKALFVQRFKREPAFGSESAALSGESPESMRARADNALAPHERYRRLAGEVEARNTQARQGMTDEQRRATPPSQTADVADSRVIVMFNGKEMANAPMPANAAPDAATTAQPLRTPAATIRAAITKAYGKLLDQLESKGLVTLTQTEDEAIEAAAQARAAKTGQSVEQARSTLRASVKNSVADQTQTENFQRWFAGSRVRDANGRPLVVYHGTHSSFTEFKPNDALGGGMFFSPSPEEAGAFTGATGSNIMPVYLSAQKVWPKIVRSYDEVKAIRAAKSKGYDAIRVRDDQNGVVNWVVFDPTQVKSATGNNGDFDPANPDIRRSADGSIQGFFDPQTGQSFLIADNLTAEAAPGVLMHEVGIHMAADGSMKALFNRAAMMLKLQRGNPFMKAVQDRMDAAGETSGEEAAAYIAEAYENDRANAPASVQRWLADLLAAVKAWMFKKGIMGADRLTVADIAAVARANARSMARDGGATGGQGFGTAFSRAPVADQTDTPAFKKWFGASQVVDADGKPLVVYHGTNVGINEFKPAKGLRSAGGLFESSATSPFKFFSPDKEEAQSYANAKGGHRLFSVYLRMERPLDSTTPDGLARMHRLFGSLDDTELSEWADSAVDLLDGIDELRATTPAEKSYFIKRDAKGRVIGQRATEREGYILEKYTAEDHAAEIERDLAQLIVEYEALLSAVPSSDAPLSVWAALDEPDSGDRLRAAGFDGLVFHENDGKKTFAVLDSTQIKSAVGNNGDFDPANADIRFSRATAQSIASSMGDMTPDQEKAYKNVAGVKAVPTVRERMDALKANLGLKLRQGLVDQFAAIKQLDQNAYVQARMSKGTDGTLEAILMYGKPFMRDGAPDVDVKDGGFAKVLASLKGEQDRWMMWIAAQRAEKLKAEGKENLMTDDDISALKTLHAGKMADGTARMPIYAKALAELNEYNDAMLKLAMESGLIDQAAYDLMAGQPYVPFYRLMEDGDMKGPKFSSGLTNQKAWQKLKGGTQQLNADLLQNMLLNWSHLLQASAKNRAATATMDAAEKMAVAYKVDADTKGSVKVMRDGSAEHWMVEDPYLLDAISAIHYVPSPLMKPLAKFKQLLTWGVTVNPTFKIRNLIRDSVSAIAQSELGYNPAANVAKGWKLTAKDSQIYASMLASGGLIKFGTQENTDRLRAQVAKLGGVMLDKGGAERFFGQIKDLYDVYNEFGDRAENVNRAALYDALIKKGKTHAEAAFMARDLMDFSMGGSAPVVRFLTQTVPFLNARLVGLDKLGRAAMEDPRRFAAVTGAVALASLALMAGYSDDEDWKKREDWDRDAYWWFKIGGQAYRIPKPFEVGAIGTLAERTAELMLSDEMTGKRYMERVSHMLSGTFSFNPVPQAFKPLLDLYANKDSFTGRAIESQADQRLRPQDRYSERTPEVAKFLGGLGLPDPAQLVKGEYSALSPKQVEHLVRGYFSWVGTAAMTVSDFGLRPLAGRGERPDMRLKDVFIAGNFVENLPTGSSRYVTQMYEQSRQVEQAYASYQEAIKAGDMEKAQSIKESAGPLLRNRPAYTAATRQLAEINRTAKRIEADRDMAGAAKRARLTELEQQRQVIAQRVSRLAAATP